MSTTTETVKTVEMTLEAFIAKLESEIKLRQLWRSIAGEAQSPTTPQHIRESLIQTLESLTQTKITL